ncbi:MAG: sn-glycerol-3-phosphate ABC transporter ATP-binding protein UgpC [Alcaligenaceae bacterium]
MSAVVIRQVRKSFGQTLIIDDLSVDIESGEFVVFVGPSGCGKSTLLRMIAGLESFEAGHIEIDGRQMNGLHPSERDVAMVFQDYALYPHMNVRKNMGFGLKMRKFAADEIETRVTQAADMLQITHLLSRLPKELSGGQRQRVAMGRAMVRHPKVFLFDEPLSNLDAKLRVDVRAEIKSLHQRLKTTSIYVTHDQVEAMTMADRIVVLNHGQIEQVGTPLALYRRPASKFVAGFLGAPAMNFIQVDSDKSTITLPTGERLTYPSAISGRADLGLRAETLTLAKPGDVVLIRGKILLLEPLGSDTLATIDYAGQKLIARLAGDFAGAVADTLAFTIDLSQALLFDLETGRSG